MSAAAGVPWARSVPSLDPDERTIAWLASGPGETELVLHDLASARETRLPAGRGLRLAAFRWSFRPGTGIGEAHALGEEGGALLRFDRACGRWSQLYPPTGDRLSLIGLGRRRPDELLVRRVDGLGVHHYESVSIPTGEVRILLGGVEAGAVYFNRDFEPRLIETPGTDGSRDIWHLAGGGRGPLFLHIPHEEALSTRILDFDEAGGAVYAVRPLGREGAELVLLDCDGRRPAGLRSSCCAIARGDIVAAFPPVSGDGPGLVKVERAYSHLVALDGPDRSKLGLVRRKLGRRIELVQRSSSDALWIVAASHPRRYFLVSTAEGWVRELGPRPQAGTLQALCRPVIVRTRDGAAMRTYVGSSGSTVRSRGRRPVALLIHGGPWRRARPEPLWTRDLLARAGCLVVEPNFRASTGFGTAWINAGDGAWGGAMQDDLEDALEWAVRHHQGDPGRVLLVGGSYGGYAALQMAATSARPLRAVVATAPVVDPVDFVADPPVFWKPAQAMLRRRIGDPSTAAGALALAAVSPLHQADRIRVPTLLVHGGRDPRAKAGATAALFMKLARAGVDSTLSFFPDEGHEILTARNRRALSNLVESFVAKHLFGASVEPLDEAERGSMKLMRSPAAVRGGGEAAPGPVAFAGPREELAC